MAAFAHVASMTPRRTVSISFCTLGMKDRRTPPGTRGPCRRWAGPRAGRGWGVLPGGFLGLPPSPPLCPALLFIRFLSAGRDGHPQTRLMRPLVCELEEKMKNPSSPRGPYKNLERG